MPESFEVEAIIPAEPARVYAAWLDTKEHGAFTGAPALVEPWVGGRFTAHDGYLHGITLQLEPGKRIVQAWRSSEFPQGSPDSRIYIDLEPVAGGTRLHIKHIDIPLGHGKVYKPGWEKHYFKSMVKYFANKPVRGRGKAAAGEAAKPVSATDAASERPVVSARPAVSARASASARPPAPAKASAAAKRAAPGKAAAKRAAPEKRRAAKRPAPKRPAGKAKRAPAHAAAKHKRPAKSARARPAAKKSARKGRR